MQKTLTALIAAFLSLAVTVGATPSARADFIYNLSVTGNWTGSGAIAFNAPSGSDTIFSDTIGVSVFAFHVDSGHAGGPQDYDLTDLDLVNWSIDSSFNLSLFLQTALIPFGSAQSAILLAAPGFHSDPCIGFTGS